MAITKPTEVIEQQLKPARPQVRTKRNIFFQIFLVALISSFLILTILAKSNPYFPIDLMITQTIQTFDFFLFDIFMRFLTTLGNNPWGMVLIITAVLFFYLKHKKDESVIILISTVGVYILSETFKNIVARPRPDGSLIIQIGLFVRNDSFPSGHVLFFVGFFGYLLFLTYTRLKRSLVRTFLITIFSLMLGFIGISRIYLGAHWFSDTLGSYLIGSAWLLIVVAIIRPRIQKLLG